MKQGYLILEVLLASVLFVILATGGVVGLISALNFSRSAEERVVATNYAQEGLEAARSIRNQGYASLALTAGTGIARNGTTNVWEFNGVNNNFDKYTRIIKVETVNRDGSGNIVTTPAGSLDTNTKKVTSMVTWNFNSALALEAELSQYLTNWKAPIISRGGFLVYGDGGTTSDAVKYRILDADGVWGAATAAYDVDTGSTNRYLRAVRVYASATRNEKIAISRHYNGTTQYIYTSVFDGSAWSTPVLLSSWAATNYLDVQNFDGAYLANGNFMAVYRDGTTTIPKMKIWDGNVWTTQANTANVGGIPTYIVIKNRPGTNEVMMGVFDQLSDTNTAYYSGSAWSAATEHSVTAPLATKKFVNFAWSNQNSLKGFLIYAVSAADININLKIWTADGTGSGTWSMTSDSPTSGGRLGTMIIGSRKGAEEALACQKDANNDIYCFRSDTATGWSTPTNNILTTTSDTGIQRSMDVAYEAVSGSETVAVYSINSNIPKYRLYTAGTNAFGAETNLLTGAGTIGAALETAEIVPHPDNDNLMVLLGDTSQDLRTVVWDGTNNGVFTAGGNGLTVHGTSGSADEDFWFSFAWDRY